MRIALAVLALSLGTAGPAASQTPAPPPAAASPATAATTCEPREANLAGIGRASIVAFIGAVFRERVCATVANVALDALDARILDPGAPVTATGGSAVPFADASLGDGGNVAFALAGANVAGVGPYVVEPGGRFPSLGGDTAEQSRVVLAYAGARLLLIAMTPVTLADVARVLRDQPDLFGADAVERAVVLASGPDASLLLRSDEGALGRTATGSHRVLEFAKRS
jgi:hypothetical protein